MFLRRLGQLLAKLPVFLFCTPLLGKYHKHGIACSHILTYFSTSANNFALKGKRKTLAANDVFSALEDMEFQHFIPELKECLEGKNALNNVSMQSVVL